METGVPENSELGGDVHALDIESVVAEHMQSVYRYAFRLTGQSQEAEDLTQQTFLIAQQRLYQVREADKVVNWLFTVLRSCFLKARRKKQPILSDAVVESEHPTSTDSTLAFIDREHLQTALDRLSDEARIVVLLFYYEGRSYKEIAADLQVPIGTVMSRLARAKQRLKSILAELDPVSPATPVLSANSAHARQEV